MHQVLKSKLDYIKDADLPSVDFKKLQTCIELVSQFNENKEKPFSVDPDLVFSNEDAPTFIKLSKEEEQLEDDEFILNKSTFLNAFKSSPIDVSFQLCERAANILNKQMDSELQHAASVTVKVSGEIVNWEEMRESQDFSQFEREVGQLQNVSFNTLFFCFHPFFSKLTHNSRIKDSSH